MDRHHRKYKSREMKVKTCSDRFETFPHSNRLGVRSILSGNTTSFEPVLAEKEYFWCLAQGLQGRWHLENFQKCMIISISGHFWPPVTRMICVRYVELWMYNMFGVIFLASVTSFGQKCGCRVHFGLGENRDSGQNRRLSRFLGTSGHLSPG